MTSLVIGTHAGPVVLLHEVPTETVLHLLRFAPDSALLLRAASSKLKQIADDFLQWNQGEIVRALSRQNVHPFLYRCIQNIDVHPAFQINLRSVPNALSFHVLVRRAILALDVPRDNFPGTILSPEGIPQCNSQIQAAQDRSLEIIWGRLRNGIIEANPGPVDLPVANGSAQEIRTWMQAGANQPLLQGITELCLKGLQLRCVQEGVFQGLTALQALFLDNNRLVSLPEGVFQGLTALRVLRLDSNHLVSLPEGVFQGLTALRTLFLDNNHLVSLPEGVFRGLTALQTLFLYNNHLVSLPEGVFQRLTALQVLFLSNNHLVSLPEGVFHGLTALLRLFLYNNQLVSLPEGVFHGLTALQTLLLDNNHLVSLPEGVFEGLTTLQILYFSSNHLVSLPEGVFQGLTALQDLHLYGNPRLLVSYKDFPGKNNLECRGAIHEFFNYTCVSQFAAFYKLAAGNGPLNVVREAFFRLPSAIRNVLYEKVWVEAGRPVGDPQWGEHHAFEDMPRLQWALKQYVTESFEGLSQGQKNRVYGHVQHLAREQGVPVDPNVRNWGEEHAFDNILRLIDAMQQLSLNS